MSCRGSALLHAVHMRVGVTEREDVFTRTCGLPREEENQMPVSSALLISLWSGSGLCVRLINVRPLLWSAEDAGQENCVNDTYE